MRTITLDPMDVRTMSTLFALLTVVADLVVLAALVLTLGARVSGGLAHARDVVWDTVGGSGLWLAFAVAATATLGSLYFSQIAHFVPCTLCWFQRIAMYPLAIILAIAAWRRDLTIWIYVVPLATIGAAISIYHYQLERFPSQASPACTVEAPCTVVWVWRFHFVSIPFMALSGFALIVTLVLIARRALEPLDTDDEAAILASEP